MRTKIFSGLVGLSLLCGPLVYAQKTPKPTGPDNTQETKKLKDELDASKAEIARLNDALKKLQDQLDEAKSAGVADLTAQQEAMKALAEQLSTLQTSLDTANESMLSLGRSAKQSTRLALAAEGVSTYKRHCATCHGDDGKGKGASAQFLDQTPRDFTRGTYKFRTTPTGTLPTTEDIARTIREGIPGTSMTAWGKDLSAEQITQLAAVLETFSPRFTEEDLEPSVVVPKAPANLKELAPVGRSLYLSLGCNQCHGDSGKGDGPSKALKDETGQKILATNFTKGVFKSGPTNEDIYRSLSTGLDGTPMPSYYDAILLSREQLEQAAEKLSKKDAEVLREFAKTQPEEAPAVDSQEADVRRWALVAYVRSLAKKRTFIDWLLDPMHRYDITTKSK